MTRGRHRVRRVESPVNVPATSRRPSLLAVVLSSLLAAVVPSLAAAILLSALVPLAASDAVSGGWKDVLATCVTVLTFIASVLAYGLTSCFFTRLVMRRRPTGYVALAGFVAAAAPAAVAWTATLLIGPMTSARGIAPMLIGVWLLGLVSGFYLLVLASRLVPPAQALAP